MPKISYNPWLALAAYRETGESPSLEMAAPKNRRNPFPMPLPLGHFLEDSSLLIDRLPLAYILYDAEGRALDWNPAAEKIFGYTKEEVLGRNILELILDLPLECSVQKVLDRLKAGDMNAHIVNENRTRDGRIIICDWFNTPLTDENGEFAGGISLAQDITERKRGEIALQESNFLLKAVIEGIPEAIYIKDRQGRYLLANSAGARLVAMKVEDIIGKDDTGLFSPETARRIMENDRRVMATGQPETYDQRATAAGISRAYLTTKAPFFGPQGEIQGVLGISRDISERKRAEKAMHRNADRLQALSRRVVEVQEEERRHLARELHDEIGQILSGVSINLKAVKEDYQGAAGPRLDECIAIVDQAIQQVRSLSIDLRPTMLDTLGLVPTLRWYADRQAQRVGFTLHFSAQPMGIHLPKDLEIACYRLVQEALTNVARHARARQVWLGYWEREGDVGLVVRDDGLGFDPAAVQAGAREGKSFGVLGMQERVELLGGAFFIHSEPGAGTVIKVRFPLN